MKKYFTTGIAIFLPLVLTLIIVFFIVNFLTKPFLGGVEALFSYFGWTKVFPFYYPKTFIVISKILILSFLVLIVFISGALTNVFFINFFFRVGDRLIHAVPLINTVYKACKDVVHSLFSSTSTSFSQVVLVPFPSQGSLSVGLVTKESISLQTKGQSSDFIPVFIPGTPNPTVGFLLMIKKEQLIFVDMSIEEAMKFVISCGIVNVRFGINKK